MGYRSDVVIGMKKTVLAEALLRGGMPKLLTEYKHQSPENAEDVVYWRINSIKWYESYPEIAEVESFFAGLAIRPGEESLFGAIRIGENDDDAQEWGDPYEFGIELVRSIEAPI